MEILEALSLWIGQEAKPWLVQEVRKGNTKRIPVIESLYVVGSCTMLFYVVVLSFLFSPGKKSSQRLQRWWSLCRFQS